MPYSFITAKNCALLVSILLFCSCLKTEGSYTFGKSFDHNVEDDATLQLILEEFSHDTYWSEYSTYQGNYSDVNQLAYNDFKVHVGMLDETAIRELMDTTQQFVVCINGYDYILAYYPIKGSKIPNDI